jgi:hypothetical protein
LKKYNENVASFGFGTGVGMPTHFGFCIGIGSTRTEILTVLVSAVQ